jgi:NAD(P)-dependent dehydrogenase (short-subunit alcohol dehydrogenase family)
MNYTLSAEVKWRTLSKHTEEKGSLFYKLILKKLIMKVLIIGGYGTIGQKVAEEIGKRHDVITAGRNSGDVTVDIASSKSIEELFKKIPNLDACLAIAGEAHWGDFEKMTEEQYYIGIRSKLMGQINLVRIGQHYLNDGGSFTLTTGILADDPVKDSAGPAMVNGAIHSFVLAAAQDLKRGLRINVVSAGLVEEAVERYAPYFPGHDPIPMWKVTNGYVKSVEGVINGQIIRIY